MDINIRNHIMSNFKNDNKETLKKTIEECINENDEVTLPGMGVFFEIIWQNADQKLKNEMLEIIKNRVSEGLEGKEESN